MMQIMFTIGAGGILMIVILALLGISYIKNLWKERDAE
jgi:hypothetical protein